MISWILPLTALNASQLSVIMSVFFLVLYLCEQWLLVPVHLCFGLNRVRVQVSTFVSGCFHLSSKLLLLLECLNTYYFCCMILLAGLQVLCSPSVSEPFQQITVVCGSCCKCFIGVHNLKDSVVVFGQATSVNEFRRSEGIGYAPLIIVAIINKTNDLILNLTPENVTQHSRIVTTTPKGSSTPTKMSKMIGRQIH